MLQSSRPAWPLMIPLLLIVTFIAAPQLIADRIWYDEYWSIYNSGGIQGPLDFAGVWSRTYNTDPGGMGVLYHWLLNVWQAVIGNSPFSVRAFSLLFGVLTISAVYRAGRIHSGVMTGLMAAVIIASSVLFGDYLHEIRAYTLITFLAIWTIISYQRVMATRKMTVFWLLALVLSLTGLAYTHYVALAMGAVIGVVHLLRFERRSRWWLVLLALFSVLLWMLPWFSFIWSVIQLGMDDVTRQVIALDSMGVLQEYIRVFTNGNLAFALLLLIFTIKDRQRGDGLLWLWLLLPLLLVLIVNALVPFVIHIRYLLLTLPAVALLLALGIQRLRTIPAGLLLAVWLIVGAYHMGFSGLLNTFYGQIERQPAAAFEQSLGIMAERATPDDLALINITRPGYAFMVEDSVLSYYAERYQLDVPLDVFETLNDGQAMERDAYLRDVRALLRDAPIVWTLIDPRLLVDWRFEVADFVLRTEYALCEMPVDAPDMRLSLYSRMPDRTDASFGDGLLRLTHLERGTVTEDSLRVILGLTMPDLPPDTYSLGLHLYDEKGNFVRQVDTGLSNQRPYACVSQSVSLTDLPAGQYELRVVIYDWQTGERLLTDTGADFVTMGRATVP